MKIDTNEIDNSNQKISKIKKKIKFKVPIFSYIIFIDDLSALKEVLYSSQRIAQNLEQDHVTFSTNYFTFLLIFWYVNASHATVAARYVCFFTFPLTISVLVMWQCDLFHHQIFRIRAK